MIRLLQSYDLLELQQLRVELTARGIDVYMSDEFTYAIPGLPGAEQPRALWVTKPEDLMPARRVVADLLGEHRIAPLPDESPEATAYGDQESNRPDARVARVLPFIWGIITALVIAALLADA